MEQQFGTFTASELYCPKCKCSQPVREKLLLILPTGELHEFLCSRCATSVGKRTVSGPALAQPGLPQPQGSGGMSERTRGNENALPGIAGRGQRKRR